MMPQPPGSTWAGTHAFAATGLIEARTADEVRDVVRRRTGRVRAVGTRHSFNDLADTDGLLLSVAGIDPAPALADDGAVTIGAGARYGDLAAWLHERGRALHNMGSLPHISVGGGTATGTHGSGDRLGSLSTAVRALEYVGADGERHVARRGDPDFAGMVVHLGAIGIVTRLTLDTEPSYDVRQDRYADLPWDVLTTDLAEVTGSARSVSVFAMWSAPTVQSVLRKSRVDEPPAASGLGDGWLGARRVEAGATLDTENWTPQDGTAGPWLHRLPHFRLDATPSVGDEIQTEYFVPREDGPAAIAAMRALGADLDAHLAITELRTVAADDLWLSGAYRRDTLAIHFTWMPHPDAVRALLPRIEAALEPFAARPHWGKWHAMTADRLREVFPRLDDAAALVRRLDPDGVFTNAHLTRLGLR